MCPDASELVVAEASHGVEPQWLAGSSSPDKRKRTVGINMSSRVLTVENKKGLLFEKIAEKNDIGT